MGFFRGNFFSLRRILSNKHLKVANISFTYLTPYFICLFCITFMYSCVKVSKKKRTFQISAERLSAIPVNLKTLIPCLALPEDLSAFLNFGHSSLSLSLFSLSLSCPHFDSKCHAEDRGHTHTRPEQMSRVFM